MDSGRTAGTGPGSTSSGLVEGMRRREPEAWRRLAHLYGPLVYRWCRRAGLAARDAEDVLQEVFLTVAQRIGDFHHGGPGDTFRGWLWTITRHKVGDWLRRSGRERAAGGAAGQALLAELPAPPDDEPPEEGDLYHRALALIQGEFTAPTWQAFWRVVAEGQDPADVAADLGLSRNAVYIARSRVLRRLREELGDAGP